MIRLAPLLLVLACATNETISAQTGPDSFALDLLNGKAFGARATITFTDGPEVSGQAPCNRWFATNTVPAPWFALSPIGATRMACPDIAAESAYLSALAKARTSEVAGDTLILRGEGLEMVFRRIP